MLYKDKHILLIIVNSMYKIKDYLHKYNKEYQNITSIDKLINIKDLILENINKEYKLKINKEEFDNVFSKYSYLKDLNLILDTNYKSNYDYNSLISLFNKKCLPFRHNDTNNNVFAPYGSQWIHDVQHDDIVNKPEIIRRRLQYEKLASIKYPAQRSPEWFAQRDGKITASDAGVVIGDNKYEYPYKMIVKKIRETFQNNEATYHGKKYEDIAKLIYEYRKNVIVNEFGMCEHTIVGCLGASPDGIVTPYKNDGVHLTELVGRMLEIKVPLSRQIQKTGEVKGEICPIYYWDQVQMQLECCDLDECDFWQCKLCEYSSWDMFVEDTCKSEPFRSKTTSFEKGCLIQILPADKLVHRTHPDYLKIVHEYAKFIHPPKIEMTPEECKIWADEQIKNLSNTHPTYFVDRIIYWFLSVSHCETINRDKAWFESVKHKYEEMWADITFVRSEQKYKQIILNVVDKVTFNDKMKDKYIEPLKNDIILKIINKLKNNKYNKIDNILTELNSIEYYFSNKTKIISQLEEISGKI